MVGESLGQRSAQLGAGVRSLGEQRPSDGQDRIEVDVAERGREVAVAGKLGVEHGLHERAEEQAVVGADEVDRRPHDDRPHDASLEQQLREGPGTEPLEPRPECRVRVRRNLRLQSDELLDRAQDRQVRALKKQLALERRPVQLPATQYVGVARSAQATASGTSLLTSTTTSAGMPRRFAAATIGSADGAS